MCRPLPPGGAERSSRPRRIDSSGERETAAGTEAAITADCGRWKPADRELGVDAHVTWWAVLRARMRSRGHSRPRVKEMVARGAGRREAVARA